MDCECAYKDCDCDCADPVLDISVGEVIVHENYYDVGNSKLNDIALVRLSKKLEKFTEFIVPICLANPNTQYGDAKSRVVATGWGFSEKGGTLKCDRASSPFIHQDNFIFQVSKATLS